MGDQIRQGATLLTGILVSAAIALSDYKSPSWAIVAGALAVVAISFAVRPDWPQRFDDWRRADPSWKAPKPFWSKEFPGSRVMLTLTPPPGHEIDSSLRCEVAYRRGRPVPLQVRPPQTVRANDVPNEHYYALYPERSRGQEDEPLSDGPYRIAWLTRSGVPGVKLLAVRRFRIRNGSIK